MTGYNGIFNVTDNINKFHFTESVSDEDGFSQIIIPKGAIEIESLNNEIKRIFIEEGHFTEINYPFAIKPNFSTLGSIITISTQGPIITFPPDDSIRDLLGFNNPAIFEEYNLSPNFVDIISFDNILIETDIAKGMIYKGKRTGIILKYTMTISPGYNFVKQIRGVVK